MTIKIIILLIFLYLLYLILRSNNTNPIRSTFNIPFNEKDLMQKNTVYIYVNNPFRNIDDTRVSLDTLRNVDDPTDRTKMTDLLQVYFDIQNMYYQLLPDINSTIEQIKKLHNYTFNLHTSALSVVDFSNETTYQDIMYELSNVLDTSKQTFASLDDLNIAGNIIIKGQAIYETNSLGIKVLKTPNGNTTIKANTTASLPIISYVPKFSNTLIPGMYVEFDNNYSFLITAVTASSVTIQNVTSKDFTFVANNLYKIFKIQGPPMYVLTNWLYDQSVAQNEIIVVFNRKVLSLRDNTFDSNIYTLRYDKKTTPVNEAPPYVNFRRQQLKTHFLKNYIF